MTNQLLYAVKPKSQDPESVMSKNIFGHCLWNIIHYGKGPLLKNYGQKKKKTFKLCKYAQL